MRACLFFYCLCLTVPAVQAQPATLNLLVNGDFETGGAGPWEKRTPDNPDRALYIMPEAARAGKAGARITNHKRGNSRWRQGGDGKIQVPPGTTVRLSGWIRTDLQEPDGCAALRLYCMRKPEEILTQPTSRPVTGKSDWGYISVSAVVPADTAFIMPYLELQNAVGTADYDDLTLTVIAPPEPRPATADLLLMTDFPADDPPVRSLQSLYPGRLVLATPGEKVAWERYHGAILLGRTDTVSFDITAAERFAAAGNPVVMDLSVYARARHLRVEQLTGPELPLLRITRAHPITRGFAAGDTLPWGAGSKGAWSQRVVRGSPPGQVLAESSRGGALLITEAIGKGSLVAADLTGLPEPAYNQPGSLNKYLFLGNTLGAGVCYGQYYPRRLSYAEFVAAMRSLAAELPSLRVQEEGPTSGAERLYSLNLGDPRKPAFLLYAATHGSEWEPAYGLLTLARLLATYPGQKLFNTDRYCLKILPILNPTGYDRNTRHNTAGVDLNRNGGEYWETFRGGYAKEKPWGPGAPDWKGTAAFSEPETASFRALCERLKPYATLDFHGNQGGPGNNRLIVLPLTALPDNEEHADNAVRSFNRALRDRVILREANRPGVEQYAIEATHWDSPRPTLIQTACKNRYGFLCEVPAGYSGTYGLVYQTEIVVETCLAFFRAYQ